MLTIICITILVYWIMGKEVDSLLEKVNNYDWRGKINEMIRANCKFYIIDLQEAQLPDGCHHEFEYICLGASEGIKLLAKQLDDRLDDPFRSMDKNEYQY